MTAKQLPPLIETDWLQARLQEPDLRIVDARFFLPNEHRDARGDYRKAHLPGAVFFDIDAVCDPGSMLPHMLPSPTDFATTVGAMGIGNVHRVICYDDGRYMGACRAWWMFRLYGHDRVAVLNGGLPAWRAARLPLASGEEHPVPASFRAGWRAEGVADLDRVRRALDEGSAQVVDARSPERFAGRAPEPRPGLRSGHMPGAMNLPFTRLIGPDGRLLDHDALAKQFAQSGIDDARPVITSCGSGVSAAVLLLALHLLGHEDMALYDGSWAEWGVRSDTPVVSD
jgi:thiosulfate/3-mercaptopyruvate sulfurtransferase